MATIKSYTDLEQSKKLAEILPIESADNVIVSFGSREGTKTVVMPKETLDVFRTPFADIRETTMCWSLAALISVLSKSLICTPNPTLDGYCCKNIMHDLETYGENPVDACYEMILKLHELKML